MIKTSPSWVHYSWLTFIQKTYLAQENLFRLKTKFVIGYHVFSTRKIVLQRFHVLKVFSATILQNKCSIYLRNLLEYIDQTYTFGFREIKVIVFVYFRYHRPPYWQTFCVYGNISTKPLYFDSKRCKREDAHLKTVLGKCNFASSLSENLFREINN